MCFEEINQADDMELFNKLFELCFPSSRKKPRKKIRLLRKARRQGTKVIKLM